MKLEELIENIYHVSFPTRKEAASTFLRFQEHYESPQFRGKIFSLDEFKEWYTANSEKGKAKGKFTYYDDWGGFNIPSYILEPFYKGLFNPLSEKESKPRPRPQGVKKRGDTLWVGGARVCSPLFTSFHTVGGGSLPLPRFPIVSRFAGC